MCVRKLLGRSNTRPHVSQVTNGRRDRLRAGAGLAVVRVNGACTWQIDTDADADVDADADADADGVDVLEVEADGDRNTVSRLDEEEVAIEDVDFIVFLG